MERWSVGEVASLTGLTVRALHHYEAMGLLDPRRDGNGYRAYRREDLEVLQQIGWLRAVGMSVRAIRRVLHDPDWDRSTALHVQRDLLRRRRDGIDAMLTAVEAALAAEHIGEGAAMKKQRPTAEAMFAGNAQLGAAQYEQEARQRWGHTDSYKESQRRVGRYGESEWATIHAESAAIEAVWAEAKDAGLPPDAPACVDAAERWRAHIDRWYYPCSPQMIGMLAEGYVDDERFRARYDAIRPGFAVFVRDAIRARVAAG